MKERRWNRGGGRRGGRSLFAAFFGFACLVALAFSAVDVIGGSFRPVLKTAWPSATMNAVSTEHLPAGQDPAPLPPSSLQIMHAISSPDQVLLVLKNTTSLPTSELRCLYHLPSPSPPLHHPPLSLVISQNSLHIHCPLGPPTAAVSISPSSPELPPVHPYQWDHIAYAALIDPHDNSTVVFVKGFNLRPGRLGEPSRYECVFGWDFSKPRFLLTTPVLSAAQEVFRCMTPLSVLQRRRLPAATNDDKEPPLVSIKTKGRGAFTLPSVARPHPLPRYTRRRRKAHSMCVCTMLRNQARVLREWIIYHSRIGVGRWFIYDNNSDDDLEQVLDSMASSKYNVTRQPWPWVKSQEAGFAHCALTAREHCEWVGFIDVDEFLYFPGNATLQDMLQNYTSRPRIGELRTACHSFGPSGRRKIPKRGVMAGYTCRMTAPERHKSIIRPDALNPSLINVVHHFHLKEGMRYVNVGQGVMVINHYKYQVWDVFKEKFYRRVATYVADWQDEENVGSKDRAPGLGTKPVEPEDWPSRFCEVQDIGLKEWVLQVFADPRTGNLPW